MEFWPNYSNYNNYIAPMEFWPNYINSIKGTDL